MQMKKGEILADFLNFTLSNEIFMRKMEKA